MSRSVATTTHRESTVQHPGQDRTPTYEGRVLPRPDEELVDQGLGSDVGTLLSRLLLDGRGAHADRPRPRRDDTGATPTGGGLGGDGAPSGVPGGGPGGTPPAPPSN